MTPCGSVKARQQGEGGERYRRHDSVAAYRILRLVIRSRSYVPGTRCVRRKASPGLGRQAGVCDRVVERSPLRRTALNCRACNNPIQALRGSMLPGSRAFAARPARSWDPARRRSAQRARGCLRRLKTTLFRRRRRHGTTRSARRSWLLRGTL